MSTRKVRSKRSTGANRGCPCSRTATMMHEYKRHGTATLFAALDIKSGLIVGECLPRHCAKESLRFLRKIDRATSKSLDLHLALDNYATHNAPEMIGSARPSNAATAALTLELGHSKGADHLGWDCHRWQVSSRCFRINSQVRAVRKRKTSAEARDGQI